MDRATEAGVDIGKILSGWRRHCSFRRYNHGVAPLPGLIVRHEVSSDIATTDSLLEQAFGRPDEARLVEALRGEGSILLSLIAEIDGCVAGHILFTRMWIEIPDGSRIPSVALAPLAVLPQWQRRGVGGTLIPHGLALLRERGESSVIVVGHPEYYSRFGFSCETAQALESPFPRAAFMAVELRPGALQTICGRVKYSPAFGL